MADDPARKMASVLVCAPQGSTLLKLVSDFPGGDLQFITVSSPSRLSAAVRGATGLTALVVHESGLCSGDIALIRNSLEDAFFAARGPVILVRGGPTETATEAVRAALQPRRMINEAVGADAIYGAVRAEVEEYRLRLSVLDAVEKGGAAIGEIDNATFRFRTREEAKNIATMLASACTEPVPVAIGLTELFVNAVEHGCLAIGHREKGRLIEQGRLQDEIKHRRVLAEYADRYATVEFRRSGETVTFRITDPGEGFDHRSFVGAGDGHNKKHGRGITMAGGCFDEIRYIGKGNEVVATYKLGEKS